MRHDQRDKMKDYWSTLDQYFMALYSNTLKQTDCIVCSDFYILLTIKNEHDKTDEN